MTNPYDPSTVTHANPHVWSTTRLHRFAGFWLAVFGLIHLAAINVLASASDLSTFDWTPLFLTGLGVLIVLQFRLAIALARLIGSFTVLGLCLAIVALLAGFGDGGELTYRDVTVTDPQPWQILLMLLIIGLTMLPPWFALQRALAGNHAVNRSRRCRTG